MFGSLEKRIISVLRRETKATAREIYQILIKEGDPVTYVTVNTVLSRLHKKGFVGRTEEPYRGTFRYMYEYKEVRDQWFNDFLGDVEQLFGQDGLVHLKEMVEGREPSSEKERAEPVSDLSPSMDEERVSSGRITLSKRDLQNPMIQRIEEISGQTVLACYQCGKCSAGCPMADMMDLMPNQIIRLVQLGQTEEVLRSKTIWLCASCFSCSVGCPKGVDIAKLMEALREVLLRKGVDNIDPFQLEMDVNLPQIALISNFRKKIG